MKWTGCEVLYNASQKDPQKKIKIKPIKQVSLLYVSIIFIHSVSVWICFNLVFFLIFNINKSFDDGFVENQDLFDPLGALEVTREAEQFGASWWMCLIQATVDILFFWGSITMDRSFQYGSIWICTFDWYQGFDVSCHFCSVDSDNRCCVCRNDNHIYFQQLL